MVPTLQIFLPALLSGIAVLLQGCGEAATDGKDCLAQSHAVQQCGDSVDPGCNVSFVCIGDSIWRIPGGKCSNAYPVLEPQHKTCAEFKAWDATEKDCAMKSACCAHSGWSSDSVCLEAVGCLPSYGLQQCDPEDGIDAECEVKLVCIDDGVWMTPNSACTQQGLVPDHHHGSCAEFAAWNVTEKACSLQSGCCLLSGWQDDQVCREAVSCEKSYGVQQCDPDDGIDPDCSVKFICLADSVFRMPSSNCSYNSHTQDVHHETCAEFEDWNATEKACAMKTACCAHSGMSGDDECNQAMKCYLGSPHGLSEQLV